jgi:hypothetical protein
VFCFFSLVHFPEVLMMKTLLLSEIDMTVGEHWKIQLKKNKLQEQEYQTFR